MHDGDIPSREAYQAARSWPFMEAAALARRCAAKAKDAPIVFETGYGPSGLPHIGTFGEVVRTSMVRHAFESLTGRPTRLICFSDDMDGLRKIPSNITDPASLEPFLQHPLSRVPDPYGTHESYAAHNNARLCAFLDQFGFAYEFISSSAQYSSGRFDPMLRRMLERYDEVMEVILPTIGAERRASYSPFLPISPKTGRVLYVPMLERDPASGTVIYQDEDGSRIESPVTGGAVKLQWKADWAGRWYALGVDYEMAGEDLTESVKLSGKIVRALGGRPPAGFNYQLFLDEKGEKISKSKGNGLTIEEWLQFASPESLSLYMFQSPKKAKKLHFDIIPKTVDEYWSHIARFHDAGGSNLSPGARPDTTKIDRGGDRDNNKTCQGASAGMSDGISEGTSDGTSDGISEETSDGVSRCAYGKLLDNPVWHIHGGLPPGASPPVSFSLLLNIVNATGTSDPEILRGFIAKYRPEATPEAFAALEPLLGYAVAYFERFVAPKKRFRAPDQRERAALELLIDRLERCSGDEDEALFQTAVFDAGKSQAYETIRDWFTGLYEVTFGQKEGPRMGPFIKILGPGKTAELLRAALARGSS